MSAKSRKSAKAVDRPFDADVLAKAKGIAKQYQVVLSFEDGHWYGRGLELSNVFADGKTVNQCVRNLREAFAGWVAYQLEEGRKPTSPARQGTRTKQVNVRLTDEEKLLLETASKQKGFIGLSDFIRAAAVEATR
jgi:predicted RNase H-like HicB family nuclease